MTIRCVIYCRCSTGRQAMKDLSLPAQEKACRQYAAQQDGEVIKVFRDEGQSATTADRPAFLEALDFCRDRKNKVDALVCYDTSRFARNREDAWAYKKRLRTAGVKVVYATQTFGEDPDGAFMEGILELIDERYSKVLGQVTLRGMKENARRGNLNGSRPPYGYKTMKDESGKTRLEIVEHEAQVVRLAFGQYIGGLGYKALADWLNGQGCRRRGGQCWNWKALEWILQNETYIGTLCFLDIRVPGIHPPLVDQATFRAATEARKRRDFKTQGSTQCSVYAFSGLLVCRHCGSKLTVEKATGRHKVYSYYSCAGKKSLRNGCTGVRWRTELLEKGLEEKIVSVLFSERNFQRLERKLRVCRLKLATRKTDEVPKLKAKLAAVEQKISRLIGKLVDGLLSDEEARGLLDDLRKERDYIRAELEEITGGPLAHFHVTPATARLLREKVVDVIRKAGPRQKREFLRRFVGKIEVDASHARIHYHLFNLTAHLADGSQQVGSLASPTGFEPVLSA